MLRNRFLARSFRCRHLFMACTPLNRLSSITVLRFGCKVSF
jgi:hypothetical protein